MAKKVAISTLIVVAIFAAISVWISNAALLSKLECAFDPSNRYLASAFFHYRGGADSPAPSPEGDPISTTFDVRPISEVLKGKGCIDIINAQIKPIYEASGDGIAGFRIEHFKIVWAHDSKLVRFLYKPSESTVEIVLHQAVLQ